MYTKLNVTHQSPRGPFSANPTENQHQTQQKSATLKYK